MIRIMRVKHGYTAYKRGLCRCGECRAANTEYEAQRRKANRLPTRPRPYYEDGTFTREELLRFRKESDGQ